MACTIRLRENPPMTKSIMGEPIPEPEFVGVTCSLPDCENYGYCSETAIYAAEHESDERVVKLCWECAP